MKKTPFNSIILLFFLFLSFVGKAQSTIVKTEITEALSASVDMKNASEEGINDAYIKLKITGGNAPYTLHCFSPYAVPSQSKGSELNLNNIKSGDYLFVIQDSGGKSITKEIKISINK